MIEKVQYSGYDHWCYKITGQEKTGTGPTIAMILDKYEKDYALNHCYVDALTQNGLSVAFITHDNPAEEIKRIKPAGILLPGGFFQIPPEFIAAPYVKKELDLRQFNAYMAALGYAQENKLPTIGICAGMQMMACVLGGKTIGGINNIPHPMHRDNINKKDLLHTVNVEKNSLLYNITSEAELKVVSRHNTKIVDEFIGDFKVVARAPDGIIEAIEPVNPWNNFALGVQWHSEGQAVLNQDSADAKIFRAFAKAVKG